MSEVCLTILISVFVVSANSINQVCSNNNLSSSCPSNAECGSNNYCVCQSGFIGDCSIPAISISSLGVASTINMGQTVYYSIVPMQIGKFLQFTFNVCQKSPQMVLTFTLWGQTGLNSQQNSRNAISAPITINLSSGCTSLITSYISFGTQANGTPDLLILGINGKAKNSVIQISVTQRVVSGVFLYAYMIIGLTVFVCIILIIVGAFFIYRMKNRRRRRSFAAAIPAQQRQEYHNIQHLETFMAAFPAERLGSDRNVCPICLQQIELVEVVRKTPCTHIFHSVCIDSWCLKNLNCPVCRRDFSLEKLNQLRTSHLVSLMSEPSQYQEQWQEHDPHELELQERHEIRNSIL